MARDGSKDRRVQKTRGLLHEALASLIHEKAYDDIVVKEILARANVGRSTFYSHFRHKDELLESGIRDMLRTSETASPARSIGLADRILRFSLPLLEHIERFRAASDSSLAARGQTIVHRHLERELAELIADDLRRDGRRHQYGEHDIPRDLLARHVASTFVLVLNWWLGGGEALPATRANDVFRALVLPALTEALD